jgi:hypothetical protein
MYALGLKPVMTMCTCECECECECECVFCVQLLVWWRGEQTGRTRYEYVMYKMIDLLVEVVLSCGAAILGCPIDHPPAFIYCQHHSSLS